MIRRRPAYLTCALVIALLIPLARVAPPAVHASGSAAAWGTISYFECIPNAQNTSFCNGNYERIVNPFYAQSDSAGNFTHDASILVKENAAGAGPLCDPRMFSTPFTGTCTVSDYGSGYIKQGSTGMPDFWVADETATFHGPVPTTIHDPFDPYPVDTATPAVPGFFTAQQLGTPGPLPPGVTILTVVANSAGPRPPAVAMPLPASRSGSAVSGTFLVAFYSSQPGQGMVMFGPGPGCSGLVEVATNDLFAGAKAHAVQVTGNDLPGTVGNAGVQPGATYWYQTATVTASGVQVDDNGGACYSVTMPAS